MKSFQEFLQYKEKGFKGLFATHLWETRETLSQHLNEECSYINQMRINIIRAIREMSGSAIFCQIKITMDMGDKLVD